MKYSNAAIAACLVLLFGCGQRQDGPTNHHSADVDGQARQLARDSLIIDTHIDVPYRLNSTPADISVATDDGDFDYPRAIAGGLNAAFMSIYTPAK